MNELNGRDWREICNDVLREKQSERLNELLEELLYVLEQRARRRGTRSSPVGDS